MLRPLCRCHRATLVFGTTAWLATSILLASASGQQQQQREQNRSQSRQAGRAATSKSTLDLTNTQQYLQFEATYPQEVRVDQPYEFSVKITNSSENVTFHDVKIGHRGDSKLQIESAKLAPRQEQHASHGTQSQNAQARQQQAEQREQQEQQQQEQQQQEQQQQEEQQQEEQQQEEQPAAVEEQSTEQSGGQQEAQQQEQQRQQQQDADSQAQAGQPEGQFANVWTIEELQPGESRVLHVTASSSQEGNVHTCLALVSYTPAMCLSTKFVKPELEIVKRGPERVTICDEIEYEYFIKNAGSGTIAQFTVQDDLAEGLQTASGEAQLKFQVDGGLDAGEVRKFVARVRPTRGGTFASRAVAIDPQGSQTRSQEVRTQVIAPQLAVAVDGPDAVYVNRPTSYTVRVTNHGEGPAEMTQLVLHYPGMLRLASATRPQASDRAVEPQSNTGNAAEQQQEQQEQQQQNEQQNEQQAANANAQAQADGAQPSQQSAASRQQAQAGSDLRTQDWDIGTIEPGETRQVRVTFRAANGENVQLRAEAVSYCGRDQDVKTSLAQNAHQLEIISLPALRISVIDERDPVEAEGELTYRVIVANEGTAPDNQIQVSVNLPEQFEFVKADGPTEAQAEGRKVTFGVVEQLQPGQKAEWRLRTKAEGDGDVALQAVLQSEFIQREVTAEEPTTVFTSADNPQQTNGAENEAPDRENAEESDREAEQDSATEVQPAETDE